MSDHYHHADEVQGVAQDSHSHDVRDVSGAAEENHSHYAHELQNVPADRDLAALATRVTALEGEVRYLTALIEGRNL
jgi:hypothetical protein